MSDLMMQHLKRVTDLSEERAARIAALEADKKRLVEAYKSSLIAFHVSLHQSPVDYENTFDVCSMATCKNARALLSEVS